MENKKNNKKPFSQGEYEILKDIRELKKEIKELKKEIEKY